MPTGNTLRILRGRGFSGSNEPLALRASPHGSARLPRTAQRPARKLPEEASSVFAALRRPPENQIIAVLVSLLLPAVQQAREAARRAQCQNNIKQVVLALHNFESTKGVLPQSKRTEAQEVPGVAGARSWALDAFPYLEQGNITDGGGYDLAKSWWLNRTSVSPPAGVVMTQIAILQCPSSPNPARLQDKFDANPAKRKIGACSDYFAPEGIGATFNAELVSQGEQSLGTTPDTMYGVLRPVPEASPRFENVTDGTSSTILIGECAGREDVWRGRTMTPAQTDSGQSNCARARGGAWATNYNPYELGRPPLGCTGGNAALAAFLNGKLRINATNEWGGLYYGFHTGIAIVGMADGSVRSLGESTSLRVVGSLTTRSGDEVVGEFNGERS